MKLYTEEQLIQILFYLDITNLTFEDIKSKLELIKDVMPFTTPIELPSDEEIDKIQILISSVNSKDYCEGFSHGIDYMKEQILNQNK